MLFKLLIEPFASDYLEEILNQLSEAVLSAVNGNWAQRGSILHALRDLAKLEIRPACLTRIAYKWCSVIYGNRENFEDWESVLLACLEAGFRHLDPWQPSTEIRTAHTEHHQGLVDVVFKSQKCEAIADLLHAWTLQYHFSGQAGAIHIGTELLVSLQNLVPFSPRLRRLVIRFVEIAGYKGFAGAGVEKLVELLDHLHITVEDMDMKIKWVSPLLDVIRSSEETQRLSDWYWELLVELAVPVPWWLKFEVTDSLTIAQSLIEAQEWGKLECWIGTVWKLSLDVGGRTEEDLGNLMLVLFERRPGAAQKLGEWMEEWSQRHMVSIPESFERTCRRAREAAQQRVVT